jgi:hypothetical protein
MPHASACLRGKVYCSIDQCLCGSVSRVALYSMARACAVEGFIWFLAISPLLTTLLVNTGAFSPSRKWTCCGVWFGGLRKPRLTHAAARWTRRFVHRSHNARWVPCALCCCLALRCAALCWALLCCAVLPCVALCRLVLGSAVLCCAVYIVLCCAALSCTALRCAVWPA